MKNSDYWKKRFEILEEAAASKGESYLDTLEKQYREASKTIEAEISTWYQRFATNNNISLSEARRLLNSSELKEFKWTVQDFIKYGEENAMNQQWMKQLENASAKVHISRLEALKIQTQQQMEVLYGNQTDGIDTLARKIYSDTYYHTAYEIQRGFNVGWDLQSLNDKQLERVLSKPWTADNQTFRDKCWTQKASLVSTVQTELTQAIMRGDSPDKAIKTISEKFNVAKNKAGRLVMTESAYFASEAQKNCFNELDVERFEIVATLDSHTSALCQSLDGQVFDMKDYQPGVTAPPFHPWCRTTTVPYFEDNYGERAARGADGKTYYVPSNMKYAEWKKGFVNGGSKDGLKEIDASAIMKSKTINECSTVAEVEQLLKEKKWFYKTTINGTEYDSNLSSTLAGCDLESAKGIYKAYDRIYSKYPQLIGKINGINASSLSSLTYAQCQVGLGHGGIAVNTKYYSSMEQLAKSYAKDVASGFHPAGTSWESILTHEFGHALDDFLTNTLQAAGMKNHFQPKYVSASLRPKVMKACGLKVADAYKEVSGYASKDHYEWFAECFAEYIDSDNPRAVATEFGKMLEEIMKGVN